MWACINITNPLYIVTKILSKEAKGHHTHLSVRVGHGVGSVSVVALREPLEHVEAGGEAIVVDEGRALVLMADTVAARHKSVHSSRLAEPVQLLQRLAQPVLRTQTHTQTHTLAHVTPLING